MMALRFVAVFLFYRRLLGELSANRTGYSFHLSLVEVERILYNLQPGSILGRL